MWCALFDFVNHCNTLLKMKDQKEVRTMFFISQKISDKFYDENRTPMRQFITLLMFSFGMISVRMYVLYK